MAVVTLKAFDSTYGGSPVTLTNADNRQWLHQAGPDTGSGLLRIHKDDAAVASLPAGAIVQCLLDGTARFAWVVEPYEQTSVGEGAELLRTVSGRGTLALWESGIVYPPNWDPASLSSNIVNPYRPFSWASPDYDDSGMTSAVEIKQQSDSSTPWAGGAPQDWHDPDAFFIASRAAVAGPPPHPVGTWYARKKFTLGATTPMTFEYTGDEFYDLFLDGVRIDGDTVVGHWAEKREFSALLAAGEHYLAVRVENIFRDSDTTNVTMFILSGFETDEGGQTLGSVIVRTDNTWGVADYPATPPGWTPGKILRTLLDEVKARDSVPQPSPLTNVTVDFTDTLDSAGDPWPEEIDISFPVRATYLDVIAQLCETSIDVMMDPSQLILHAYVKGTGTDLSSGVGAVVLNPTNGTLTKLSHRGNPITATHALAQYANGRWYETSRSASVRKEVGLEVGTAESTEAVDRVASALFDRTAVANEVPAAQVEPTSGKTPYADFNVFDTISVTDGAGAAQDKRVKDIVVTTDEDANAYFDLEFFDA